MSAAIVPRILLVDDVPDKLLAVQAVLEDVGAEVVAVRSGAEALRRLLRDDYALILLDVNMPDMDGFETASLIRQRKRSQHTPIIFLTSYPDDTHAERGYSLGAVDYILAPIVPEVLRSKVSVFVKLHQMAQQIQEQADQRVALAEEHAARVAAEQANRAKNAFLANVSHELRTPMNAIIGMTDLALAEPLKPMVREYLSVAKTNAHALLELLNEILDFSKLEAGRFQLDEMNFDLRAMVEQLARGFQLQARDKSLEFHCDIDTHLPAQFRADPIRIRQILVNLLGNALKFTDHGRIEMHVRLVGKTAKVAQVQFLVRDTGIGIPPEHLENIFSPFNQADTSSTRRHGGTGLGLAIVSDLVKAMGGSRQVVSEPKAGSTFEIVLPLYVATEPSSETSTKTNSPPSCVSPVSVNGEGRPLRVLLAEDVPTNQMLVQRALGKRGHTVEVAENGQQALELAKQSNFDVILMDLQMPHLDGFQATEILRRDTRLRNIPIVALTAHAQESDRLRCLAAGMDEYLAKPLDIVELTTVVERCARSSARPPPISAEEPALIECP